MSATQTVEAPQTFAQQERQLAEAWLRYTIEHFRANLKKLRIGATGELRDSFAGTLVSAAGSDQLKLRLTYAIQGLYVDLGVGRGMGAGVTQAGGREGRTYRELRNDRGQLLRHQRRAKRWYAKQMSYDSRRLAELVSDLYGRVMITAVTTAAPAQPVQVSF